MSPYHNYAPYQVPALAEMEDPRTVIGKAEPHSSSSGPAGRSRERWRHRPDLRLLDRRVAPNYAYQVPPLDDSVLGFEAFGAVFGFVKSVYEPAKLLSARSLPTFVGLAQMLGMASAPVGSKPRRRGHRSLLKTAKFQPRLPIDHSAWRHKPLTLRGPKNGGRRLGQGHQRRLDRAWVRPQ